MYPPAMKRGTVCNPAYMEIVMGIIMGKWSAHLCITFLNGDFLNTWYKWINSHSCIYNMIERWIIAIHQPEVIRDDAPSAGRPKTARWLAVGQSTFQRCPQLKLSLFITRFTVAKVRYILDISMQNYFKLSAGQSQLKLGGMIRNDVLSPVTYLCCQSASWGAKTLQGSCCGQGRCGCYQHVVQKGATLRV